MSEREPRRRPHPALERSAGERVDDELLARLREDATTRVLVISGDAAPLAAPDALSYVSPADVPDGAHWAFLGRSADGAAIVSAVFPRSAGHVVDGPAGWAGLRAVGGSLAAPDAAVFVTALSLGRWALDAPFCPACGAPAALRKGGWSRVCTACGREHFPRTDPAVIVAITSAAHPDRLLLGSNALWDRDRYSCFAGFAEAGESLEEAVVREVREEAGVDVQDVRYHGSQAWPYPRSLMIGFLATAANDLDARADGDEIADVRWFERGEIGEALAGGGGIVLPGPASISRRLIADWYARS